MKEARSTPKDKKHLDSCKKRESKGLILVCRSTQRTFKARVRKNYMGYLDVKKKVMGVTYWDVRLR